jgi:hypothetical protein
MTQLSKDANKALIDASVIGQGATLPKGTPAKIRQELAEAELVGPGGGLTRKGSIVQRRALDALLDQLL